MAYCPIMSGPVIQKNGTNSSNGKNYTTIEKAHCEKSECGVWDKVRGCCGFIPVKYEVDPGFYK
jgi:hypothetical protein